MKLRNIFAIIALGLAAPLANAATIDFRIDAPTSGSLVFNGGATAINGTNIDVAAIVGLGTPLNSDAPIACDGCKLTFRTGNHTGNWQYGPGGEIEIRGAVPAANIGGPPGPVTEILLSGTFDGALVEDIGGNMFNFKILGAGFTDTKHRLLTEYFGLPGGLYAGGLNLSFSTEGFPGQGKAFRSTQLFSGNVQNKPVPVPAAVWLFGTGLLGLVGIARRRKA